MISEKDPYAEILQENRVVCSIYTGHTINLPTSGNGWTILNY